MANTLENLINNNEKLFSREQSFIGNG